MKKEIYIIGVGQNTPVYIDLALSCGYSIAGLYHYNDEKNSQILHGYKIIGSTDDLLTGNSLKNTSFALSMGDNKIRCYLANKIREKGGSTPNLINPTSYISRFVKLGEGIVIHANASVQAGVIIGDDSVISFNVDIAHHSIIEEACFIAGGSVLGAYCTMKKFSFIGVGAVIVSDKVNYIGKNSIIGAGAVVTGDVPNNVILAGVPAKIIKKMIEKQDVIYAFNQKALSESRSISEQQWEENTIPLVSISCTAFNHEKYIQDAIEGFLMQKTSFPVEILIHDDASTDNTANIIRDYEKQYPHLINAVYQSENQYSKNDGIVGRIQQGRARGKYYALCEGDDYWTDPYKLQKQVDLMDQNPECSMCVAQTEWVKDNNVINITGGGDKLIYDFDDIINGKYFHTSTYLIRKAMFDTYALANPKLRDGDTSLRYFLSDLGPFVLLNEKVSVYRITGSGIWTGISSKSKALWHIRVYKSFYYHFKPKYRKYFLKKLIDIYLSELIVNIKQLDIKNFVLDFNQLIFWSFKSPLYFIKSACNIIKSFLFRMVYNFRSKITYNYSKII